MNPLPELLSHGCLEGQGFGQNYNPSYHAGGLLGHTGVDVNCGYGTDIHSLTSGRVYSTYPVSPRVTQDGYTAVFVITNTPLETFEFSYGHISEIDCLIGQQVNTGDVIAKEGNYGTVYVGNTLITVSQENSGDHDGHHRHYQKRPVVKRLHTILGQHYLQTAQGIYRDEEGYYYEIYDYENGFAGCTDWTQPLFNRNLSLGSYGYDVYLLQKAIILEGCGNFNPTGIFGPLTLAGASALQKKRGIAPTYGYVGPLTRAALNQTYAQLS